MVDVVAAPAGVPPYQPTARKYKCQIMRKFRTGLLLLLGIMVFSRVEATINPNHNKRVKRPQSTEELSLREACDNAVSQIDQEINNVRARLLTGGDVWWDGNDGRYIVPKVPAGVPEVSSIFAGAVWLGGVTPGGFKVAAQTFGRSSGDFDFWPGPLIFEGPQRGLTGRDTCARWDRFFVVTGENIKIHLSNFRTAQTNGTSYDPDDIPDDVKGWPASGNPYFFDIHGFDLPDDAARGLAGYWDENEDGIYDPVDGDFPMIEIRGCTEPQFPDEMIFWIYNDAGNIHAESDGLPIRMEVQVQAFAYKTNDEVNNMTFQRYKLINRAIESINETYFAMWVDPDLGCFSDDYVGCDTTRSLAYVYNTDAADGTTGTTCEGGVNTYGTEIPLLGVDYFRGPKDENGNELGMSSFTYYNNAGSDPTPLPGTSDPQTVQEYYNYLSGKWKDGSPFTFGDDGYQDGASINYAFPSTPNDVNGWSMCSAGLPVGDRRTVQASGPFILQPGAVNELIVGVVWVPNAVYPCPNIRKLLDADDIAQSLFDNCFELTRGPDAPTIDWIELDQEVIAIFSNDTTGLSNNPYESYTGKVLKLPEGQEDSLYRFEGYRLFQLSGPDVSLADRDDPAKVREIYQVDLENGIGTIFNWNTLSPEDGETPTTNEIFVPELQVEAQNEGIRHTFRITEDQFAEGDRTLINHKKYYFVATAYAFNEYEAFNPNTGIGQREPYLEGDGNIGDGENPYYVVLPRPIVNQNLNANYGDGLIINRADGEGNGGRFLDISNDTRDRIEAAIRDNASFDGIVEYREGEGPVDIKIYNPIEVSNGEFELAFVDPNMNNDGLDAPTTWVLRNLSDRSQPDIISEGTIDQLNEQIIARYGFSITLGQVPEVGSTPNDDNGAIGYEEEYPTTVDPWFFGIPDDTRLGITEIASIDNTMYDFIPTGLGEKFNELDPDRQLTQMGPGYFMPYYLADWERKNEQDPPYLTPAWTEGNNGQSIVRSRMSIEDLNNVDIVLTSDKSLWSQCVIVETANRYYPDYGFLPEGSAEHMTLRDAPSVGKNANSEGLPEPDPNAPVEIGMGWFPGYAVDVETGQRLNIFFGENSTYDGTLLTGTEYGRDMMFNPSSTIFYSPDAENDFLGHYNYVTGGQHWIYVTKTPYDGCASFASRMRPGPAPLSKVSSLSQITWAGLVLPRPGREMLSYADGLIPEDVIIKLRVDNPFNVEQDNSFLAGDQRTGTSENNYHPLYRFKVENAEASDLDQVGVEQALDEINVVPNPYYGFSDYEQASFDNIIKITNLPAKCVVTIFSLDGRFIRQYNRDEGLPGPNGYGVRQGQITPDLEWDLNNSKGIPIASGVYLIHISAEGLGERTVKWFGINRKFDPTGL